ncbi:MAG: glutaminase A [Sphingomonadaceae bacterium]
MTRRGAMEVSGAGIGSTVVAAPETRGLVPAARDAVLAAHARFRNLRDGRLADYIPALATRDPDLFGIALTLADGTILEAGDTRIPFTLQSLSKVFTLARVLEESGPEVIIEDIGVDATGRVFNSIDAIEQHHGREMSPLVNAGAIATVGHVSGTTREEIWQRILDMHSAFAARALDVDEAVYASESATNQRNRAIGILMHAYERFPMDPLLATDLYTRQCAIAVTTQDLATMAATLAFGGRNPVTGAQVMPRALVPGLLAVMATSGLYDESGKWLFQTGCPAKSGVSGGLFAVVPGRFGVAAFSPLLDEAGNSVRAWQSIAAIIDALDANPLARFA